MGDELGHGGVDLVEATRTHNVLNDRNKDMSIITKREGKRKKKMVMKRTERKEKGVSE